MIPELAARTALGRVGEPDDAGMAIAALVFEEGRWITARSIEVSGGYNLLIVTHEGDRADRSSPISALQAEHFTGWATYIARRDGAGAAEPVLHTK